MHFTRAIVRPPAASFASGLSSATEGPPDLNLALAQHSAYVEALRACGLNVTPLQPEEAYPDGTFVEDTAIMTGRGAILMRPGAPSREGETRGMALCLRNFFEELPSISAPGTVDGGDICEADGHFLIGKKRNRRQYQRGHEEQIAQRSHGRSFLLLLLFAQESTLLQARYRLSADVALRIGLCDNAVAFIASRHDPIKVPKRKAVHGSSVLSFVGTFVSWLCCGIGLTRRAKHAEILV